MVFHLVLVCKYRNQVFDDDMLDRCREIMRSTLLRWRCELLEFGGESDHVHLVFQGSSRPEPFGAGQQPEDRFFATIKKGIFRKGGQLLLETCFLEFCLLFGNGGI